MSSGKSAAGTERSLIERLALDSPDQFVLAQLRGASYYTVARNVMPTSAGGSDDYNGPLWDVIRLGEPQTSKSAPLRQWRIFHINSPTRLIDPTRSHEQETHPPPDYTDWD